MNIRMLAALAAVVSIFASPALAQGFLDKLKDAVGSVSGSTGGATGSGGSALSTNEIVEGLREALRVGTQNVVGQIGTVDGFNADPSIHIPLPEDLQRVQGTLRRFGLSGLADDVELKLNRAAEKATPKTKELVWKAINEMTLDDAKSIYDGPEDAATSYFKRVASADLERVVKPVIDQSLSEVGAIAAYDQLMGRYKSFPMVPDVKADLSDHTTDLTLDGLFYYLAKEEAAIRQNPAKRTTDILTKVFSK